jgi:hypothetical protein
MVNVYFNIHNQLERDTRQATVLVFNMLMAGTGVVRFYTEINPSPHGYVTPGS